MGVCVCVCLTVLVKELVDGHFLGVEEESSHVVIGVIRTEELSDCRVDVFILISLKTQQQ